ncbi:ATP-dependent 6-phosphofructokinase 5, chloroplastic, partial [Mucuna pruriens]
LDVYPIKGRLEICLKRQLKVSVIGVPKTIDNDILLMDKTFGFDTAVEEAQRAINSAYIEAHSAYHGIGVVKLMGRSSGFIAMHASLSSGQVDICLIPELPFNLHGPHGVLSHLKYLLETKGSAVVCVAEGAGQNLLQKTNATDASGNVVFGDIGVYIQQETKKYFKEIGVHADVKYIDPTYMVRAIRANASDGILCTVLGQNAVHGAFAGYSGITVGLCNTHYAYFPIPEVISHPRLVDPNSRMWHRCLTSTAWQFQVLPIAYYRGISKHYVLDFDRFRSWFHIWTLPQVNEDTGMAKTTCCGIEDSLIGDFITQCAGL